MYIADDEYSTKRTLDYRIFTCPEAVRGALHLDGGDEAFDKALTRLVHNDQTIDCLTRVDPSSPEQNRKQHSSSPDRTENARITCFEIDKPDIDLLIIEYLHLHE